VWISFWHVRSPDGAQRIRERRVPHCAIGRRFAPTRRLYAGYEDFLTPHLAFLVIASSI